MTTTPHALDTLEYHKCLAEKVVDNLKSKSSNSTETVYSMYGKRVIAEINEEIQKVHQLELRMTIVASMKSGKSTIINALIGEDILPVRVNAMTIIPTEVIFKREVQEPILFLSKEIIDAIMVISKDVRSYLLIESAREEKTNELFENDPHMNSVVNEMLNDSYTIILNNEVVGPIQIQSSLLTINDLIRIYLKLVAKNIIKMNETNFEAFRNQIPRIEVPFSNTIINTDNLGNLVIVDTPGPNEAGMCKQLEEIVTVELRKADIIFVVFNYTTLNTEADAKIMSEIDELRKIRGDNSCLYAIINKVDQRREGDMSKDDVKKFISTKYGIEERSSINNNDPRIFEIKAYFGFIAKRFLIEYERLKKKFTDLKIQDMETVDDLGSVLYDFHWKTMQEKITIEKLQKGAIDMWRKSGLDELLQTVISNLMNSISARLVQSALSKCQRIDRELIECLKQYLMVLDGNTEKLNVEIQELENEMNLIKNISSKQFLYLEPFFESLQEEFKMINTLYSDEVKQLVSQLLEGHSPQKNPNPKKTVASGVALGGMATTAYMVSGLAAATLPGLTLAGVVMYHCYYDARSQNIWISGDDEAIEEFKKNIVGVIRKVCHENYIRIQKRIDTSCIQLSDNLFNSIIIKASEILKRAEQVLNIPFEMKQQRFQPMAIQFQEESIKKIDLREYFKGLFGLKLAYIIPHQGLFTICDKLVKDQLDQMMGDITAWYTTELQPSFSNCLDQLKEYLEKYMNIMQSSLNDINLNNTDPEDLREKLQNLIGELCKDLQNLTAEQQ